MCCFWIGLLRLLISRLSEKVQRNPSKLIQSCCSKRNKEIIFLQKHWLPVIFKTEFKSLSGTIKHHNCIIPIEYFHLRLQPRSRRTFSYQGSLHWNQFRYLDQVTLKHYLVMRLQDQAAGGLPEHFSFLPVKE